MKKILLIPIFFALIVLPCFAQKSTSLSNADYAQVIRDILLDYRLEKRLVLLKAEREIVYLSTENISQNLVPSKINGVKIQLKTPEEIEKSKKNWRNYIAFGKFKTNGSILSVNVEYYWRKIDAEEFDIAGMDYEFRKVGRKWEMVKKKPNVTFKF